MRLIEVGRESLLVEVADTAAATALYQAARARRVEATDLVPGARTVLFRGVRDRGALAADLPSWRPGPALAAAPAGERPVVEVPTVYDGEDLEDVARHWSLSTREVVRRHTGTEMVVAFCGFSPGFAYCTGLAIPSPVPRLERPRTAVPTGAVGLAGEFTGVYPSRSPGGWRLIGRTDLVLWDPDRDPPATLAPGTRVRFVEAR